MIVALRCKKLPDMFIVGYTALMMVKQKHYVDVITLLHEAEQAAGVGEGSCETKNAPGSNVITFLKPSK